MAMFKPPLGLVPKGISDMNRLFDVRSAIARYYDANMEIPIEWIEEYNALIRACLPALKDRKPAPDAGDATKERE